MRNSMQALARALRAGWWQGLRCGFHLLYHEMAFTYDAVANLVSLGQWWDWQRAALPFLPPPGEGTLLELAHGTGRLQRDLHQRGYHCIGLDFSPQMGRIAGRVLRRAGITPHLVRGRVQQLPFAAGSFAGLLSTFPTPFIIEAATLREAHRVLQPGRPLVFVPSGVLSKGSLAEQALEGAYAITGQRSGWGVDFATHISGFGFRVQVHQVALERSLVQVVVAEKES